MGGFVAARGGCAGLGSFFFACGISLVPPLSANIICMMEIVFLPLWALLIFGEKMSVYAVIGAVVMVIGIILNMWMESKQKSVA